MQITFPQNIYTYNNQYKQNKTFELRLKPQLSADTVSFKGSRDLLKLKPETIFKRIDKSIKKENLLGEGYEGKVYAIEDSPYCVKIPHFFYFGRPADYKQSFSTELTEKDKINHVVALLGDKTVIMKKIEGTNVLRNPDIVKDLCQFPVSSYNKFLKQISHAYDKGMYFDAINQNVIINSKNKTITGIDFINEKDTTYEPLPLHSMYFSLINSYTEPESRKLVANKILNSALEEFPMVYDFHALQAYMYFKVGNNTLARKKIEEYLASNPTDVQYRDQVCKDLLKLAYLCYYYFPNEDERILLDKNTYDKCKEYIVLANQISNLADAREELEYITYLGKKSFSFDRFAPWHKKS